MARLPLSDPASLWVTMGDMSQRSIRFPPDLDAAVSAIAEGQERSFSFIVLKAVERYVALHLQDLPPDVFHAARRESKPRAAAKPEPYKLPPSKPSPKPAVPPSRVSGVRPAREFTLDPRQVALNKAKKA